MQTPYPKPDESRESFVVRCHNELMDSIVDTDERNRVCFLAWNRETETEKLAAEEFPTDKYEHVRDVAIFAEHETTDRKGELQKYDREALQAIVDKCNKRILDTKSFAKISDGHTPGPEDVRQGAKYPEVLGFAGNFHLGMVGKLKPRWAIFADEYRYKDTAAQTAKKPGRSVEVWLHENIADRFFDPIAALGAETPRLDLPMKFAKTPSGVEVAKYSAMAGNTNTYLPEPLKAPKDRYESMLSPEEVQELGKQLAPILAQSLIGPVVQAVMQSQQQAVPPVPPVAPPVPAAPATPPVEQNAGDEFGGGMEDEEEDNIPDGLGDEEEDKDDYAGEECEDEEKEKMAKRNATNVEVAKYRRQVSDLEQKNKELAERFAKMEKDKILAERYSKLSALQSEGYRFPDRKVADKLVAGIDHEMSRAARMSDEQFNDHLMVIVENYQKHDVPMGRLPGTTISPEEESTAEKIAQASNKAAEIVEKYRREGKTTTYKAEFEAQCKELGVSI